MTDTDRTTDRASIYPHMRSWLWNCPFDTHAFIPLSRDVVYFDCTSWCCRETVVKRMSVSCSKHFMAVTQLTKTISHDVIQNKGSFFYWQLRLPDTHTCIHGCTRWSLKGPAARQCTHEHELIMWWAIRKLLSLSLSLLLFSSLSLSLSLLNSPLTLSLCLSIYLCACLILCTLSIIVNVSLSLFFSRESLCLLPLSPPCSVSH